MRIMSENHYSIASSLLLKQEILEIVLPSSMIPSKVPVNFGCLYLLFIRDDSSLVARVLFTEL